MRAHRLVIMLILAATGIGVAAQIRPYTPPQTQKGSDWTERIGELLPPGVETRAEATARIANYTPDPVKFPIPRTKWDGKPDFSGVYLPETTVTSPPLSLESLYRPDVREYPGRRRAATGLIDWRGIDTPGYHCWPDSPVEASAGMTLQLVSAPGYVLLINEGLGYSASFRSSVTADSHRADAAGRRSWVRRSAAGTVTRW